MKKWTFLFLFVLCACSSAPTPVPTPTPDVISTYFAEMEKIPGARRFSSQNDNFGDLFTPVSSSMTGIPERAVTIVWISPTPEDTPTTMPTSTPLPPTWTPEPTLTATQTMIPTITPLAFDPIEVNPNTMVDYCDLDQIWVVTNDDSIYTESESHCIELENYTGENWSLAYSGDHINLYYKLQKAEGDIKQSSIDLLIPVVFQEGKYEISVYPDDEVWGKAFFDVDMWDPFWPPVYDMEQGHWRNDDSSWGSTHIVEVPHGGQGSWHFFLWDGEGGEASITITISKK